jgi:murein DD-endopeptidase MepM/ murein hydrolase activator NlpD
MQFLRGTFEFAGWARLQDPDICDPSDAIHAAAAFLGYHGAPEEWKRELYRYNPHDAYPRIVLGWAARYGYGALVVWPVEGGRIGQRLGPTDFELEPPMCYRERCYPHFHDGLDIAGALRTPVMAIAKGRVEYAGRTGGSVKLAGEEGF